MRLTFRAKLMIIVGAAGLAFVLVILVSSLIGLREERQLADIERRLVPKLALGPQLDAQFEGLRRGLQDAVAAQDVERLAETRSMRDQLLATLSSTQEVLTAAEMANLRGAIEDYYGAALDVSRRLIGGETGEASLAAMAAMQSKQNQAAAVLKQQVPVSVQHVARAAHAAQQHALAVESTVREHRAKSDR